MPDDPTLILVHGAWHGSWCWEKVEPVLAELGVSTVLVDLPFTGFDDDLGEVRRVVDEVKGEVVLCGHSYGGRVISEATLERTNVIHLVYLAALMMDSEAIEQQKAEAAALLGVQQLDDIQMDMPDLEGARQQFYSDCPENVQRWAAGLLRPMKFIGMMKGEIAEPWLTIPSTYIVCSDDRALEPAMQRMFAKQASFVVELASSHSPFLSHPKELADTLVSIVRTGKPGRNGDVLARRV